MTSDSTGKLPRILVVARDPTLRRSMWSELEGLGCDVDVVSDEFAAMSLVETRGDDFRVAVVDGEFRHLTVFEIADRIVHLRPRIRVIVCSDRPVLLPRATSVARLPVSAVPARLVETVRAALARRAEVDATAETKRAAQSGRRATRG